MKTVFLKCSGKTSAVLLAVALLAVALFFGAVKGIPKRAAGIDPSQIKAGDFVCFGRYPQSTLGTSAPSAGTDNVDWVKANDVKNNNVLTYYVIEPIVWRVLENSGDELFLLSENIVDCIPYNTSLPSVAWENCTIRKWLNDIKESDSFINKAFNTAEKTAINFTATTGDNNSGYSTEGGNDITDQIFFLSFDDANIYFADDADRIAYNTSYSASIYFFHADYWWLRTPPGGLAGYAAYVSDYGKVYSGGHHVFYIVGVRPALKLNLSSIIFTAGDGTLVSPYSRGDSE